MLARMRGDVSERDYRLARGVFATLAGQELVQVPSLRQPTGISDRGLTRDLLRNMRHKLGKFTGQIVTERVQLVPGPVAAQGLGLNMDLCAVSSGRVLVKARPGACMLNIVAVAVKLKGAPDGYMPTGEEAQAQIGVPVKQAGVVQNETAICILAEPLELGPVFPVSESVMNEILCMDEPESEWDEILKSGPIPFDRAMAEVQRMKAAYEEALTDDATVLDPAGRVPSIVDPVQHPDNPNAQVQFGDVIAHVLSQAGYRQVRFQFHVAWIHPRYVNSSAKAVEESQIVSEEPAQEQGQAAQEQEQAAQEQAQAAQEQAAQEQAAQEQAAQEQAAQEQAAQEQAQAAQEQAQAAQEQEREYVRGQGDPDAE